jgi:hypothetical protein
MITEHDATVLPFTDALLRAPRDITAPASAERVWHSDDYLPDNVIVLARFSRQANRAHRRFWLGGPPEGEAA